MKLKVEDDKLVIYELNKDVMVYDDQPVYKVCFHLDIKELAKALKPYIDSIDNCECKK